MGRTYEIYTKDPDFDKYQDGGFWQVWEADIFGDPDFYEWAKKRAAARRYNALLIHEGARP